MKRFTDKINKTASCWLWTGGTFGRGGYGAFSNYPAAKSVGAHRFSWEFFIGKIPPGKWVLHRCNVKLCVNPDHLYLGDAQDNSDDRKKAGSQVFGSRVGNSKLTEAQVKEIKKRVKWGNGKILAREYGVCPSLISAIKNRQWWQHVSI